MPKISLTVEADLDDPHDALVTNAVLRILQAHTPSPGNKTMVEQTREFDRSLAEAELPLPPPPPRKQKQYTLYHLNGEVHSVIVGSKDAAAALRHSLVLLDSMDQLRAWTRLHVETNSQLRKPDGTKLQEDIARKSVQLKLKEDAEARTREEQAIDREAEEQKALKNGNAKAKADPTVQLTRDEFDVGMQEISRRLGPQTAKVWWKTLERDIKTVPPEDFAEILASGQAYIDLLTGKSSNLPEAAGEAA